MTNKKQDYDIVKDTIAPKKKQAIKITQLARGRVSDKTLALMKECGNFMQLIATSDKLNKKQVAGNSCKNRFCPICSWRKARKDSTLMAIMMQAIKEQKQYDYIFLTLTVPNVKSELLNNQIQELNKAFSLLSKYDSFKNMAHGYVRKLEVTYNAKRDDYHPHLHILIAVDKSYFKNTKKYITQAKWLEMWRKATKDDSITQVDIRKVKIGESNAFLELAKYSVKDSDLAFNESVFDTFYKATKGKQLIVYAGVFKEYNALYKKGLLDSYKNIDNNEYVYFVRANWDKVERKYSEFYELLDEPLYNHFNKRLLNESDIRE